MGVSEDEQYLWIRETGDDSDLHIYNESSGTVDVSSSVDKSTMLVTGSLFIIDGG